LLERGRLVRQKKRKNKKVSPVPPPRELKKFFMKTRNPALKNAELFICKVLFLDAKFFSQEFVLRIMCNFLMSSTS
jgi:hypothetical protein